MFRHGNPLTKATFVGIMREALGELGLLRERQENIIESAATGRIRQFELHKYIYGCIGQAALFFHCFSVYVDSRHNQLSK